MAVAKQYWISWALCAAMLGSSQPTRIATQTTPRNWGLDRLDQRALPLDGRYHAGATADTAPVSIYIIDTGVVRNHPDFTDDQGNNSRVTYVGDFCTGTVRTSSPETYDDGYDGHGTHIASYAAGKTCGVARTARIFSLRAQGKDGPACGEHHNGPAIEAAVNWINANGRKPAVVNLSFVVGDRSVLAAIHRSIAHHGFLYTLSGGTGGRVEDHWGPQIPGEALVVAGTDSSDNPLATEYGPSLGVFAPAKGLVGAGLSTNGNPYTIPESVECKPACPAAGDSFAAPFAAGVAAAYLATHRDASPAAVIQAIRRAATPNVVKLPVGSTATNLLLFSGS